MLFINHEINTNQKRKIMSYDHLKQIEVQCE
jgi:hypothetical protein